MAIANSWDQMAVANSDKVTTTRRPQAHHAPYSFILMSISLKNAPSMIHDAMKFLLLTNKWQFAFIYLVDTVLFSRGLRNIWSTYGKYWVYIESWCILEVEEFIFLWGLHWLPRTHNKINEVCNMEGRDWHNLGLQHPRYDIGRKHVLRSCNALYSVVF